VREITGSKSKGPQLLERVEAGIRRALQEAADLGRRHAEARAFVSRFSDVLRAGARRLAS